MALPVLVAAAGVYLVLAPRTVERRAALIVAGALWDLRELLIENLGEDAGVAQTDYIMWQIASRASDIETSYVEALLADDMAELRELDAQFDQAPSAKSVA